MVRRGQLEQVLERLGRAGRDPSAPGAQETLREALQHRSQHAVDRAAQIIGEHELDGFESDLVASFERFMAEPKKDVGCSAKAAIAEALYRLGAEATELFLRGIRHVQYEGSFGGKTDVATDLRGASALGLVRCGYSDVLNELAPLLADPAPSARIAAVRAVAYRGGGDGTPMLRLKALLGDAEPQVTTECLAGLMRIDARGSKSFVRRWLDDPDPVRVEGAALALGESRSVEAFEVLRDWCAQQEARPGPARRLVCRALALLRRDEAFDYLIDRLENGPAGLAGEIIDELAGYRNDEALRERIEAALQRRDDPNLRDAFDRAAQ